MPYYAVRVQVQLLQRQGPLQARCRHPGGKTGNELKESQKQGGAYTSSPEARTRHHLTKVQIEKRPIIFIAHSYGGLVLARVRSSALAL